MFDNSVRINLLFNNKTWLNCPQDKVPVIKGDFDESTELILCLDPSSSQTGFVLGDCKGNMFLAGDYINVSKVLSKEDYSIYLRDYIFRLTEKYHIKYFVYEVPFTSGTKDIAGRVLTFMESTFKKYKDVVVGLKFEDCYPILPGVWRKMYFSDKKYKGRKKSREELKLIAQERAIELYPQYQQYLSDKSIPDCTDAIGIYHGFIAENWSNYEQQIYKVSKVNSRYARNHDYEIQVMEYKEGLKSLPLDTNVKWFMYDAEYSLSDTASIVTSNTNNTCILVPEDKISRNMLMWECNRTLLDDETPIMICKRVNELK